MEYCWTILDIEMSISIWCYVVLMFPFPGWSHESVFSKCPFSYWVSPHDSPGPLRFRDGGCPMMMCRVYRIIISMYFLIEYGNVIWWLRRRVSSHDPASSITLNRSVLGALSSIARISDNKVFRVSLVQLRSGGAVQDIIQCEDIAQPRGIQI